MRESPFSQVPKGPHTVLLWTEAVALPLKVLDVGVLLLEYETVDLWGT